MFIFPRELGEVPGRLTFSLSEEQTFQDVHYSLGNFGATQKSDLRGDCEGTGSGEER